MWPRAAPGDCHIHLPGGQQRPLEVRGDGKQLSLGRKGRGGREGGVEGNGRGFLGWGMKCRRGERGMWRG